jgi:hypothetical protein
MRSWIPIQEISPQGQSQIGPGQSEAANAASVALGNESPQEL